MADYLPLTALGLGRLAASEDPPAGAGHRSPQGRGVLMAAQQWERIYLNRE